MKKDGTVIGIAVVAAAGVPPFARPPKTGTDPSRVHTLWIRSSIRGKPEASPDPGTTYSFDTEARINGYEVVDGTQARIAIVCGERKSTTAPHECSVEIAAPGHADVRAKIAALPGVPIVLSQLGPKSDVLEWNIEALGPR